MNHGLVVISVLAVLLFLEISLRFTPYRHLLFRDQNLRYYYRADAAKGFDIRPNAGKIRTSVDHQSVFYDIWSNELCCFDEPYRGENDFILLVGDSFTHAYAPFADKWGTRIENLLGYRVLKCGVTAYGTKEELLKAREIIARVHQSPRLIIVGYFWNDLLDDFLFPGRLTVVDGFLVSADKYKDQKTGQLLDLQAREKKYNWENLAWPYPLSFGDMTKYFLLQHLILANLFDDALFRLIPPKISYAVVSWLHNIDQNPWFEEAWARNQENLKAFKDLAAAQGAELLLVLIPTNIQVYPFLASGKNLDLERPNRILSKFLPKEQIKHLDLLPLFRKYADQTPREYLSSEKDLYWRANSHWSIKGEHLAGLLVSRYILENNLVTVAHREEKLKDIEDKLNKFY